MIEELKPYDRYQATDLPWARRLPSHWTSNRGKAVLAESMLPTSDNQEIVTCFRDGQVTLRRNRRTSGFMIALYEQGYQGVRKGQLVVHAMDAFAGAIGISDSDGKCTPEYVVCDARGPSVHLPYVAQALRVAARDGFILASCPSVRERAPRFRWANLRDFLVPLPPPEEQAAIVRFLEHANRRIDQFIRTKKKLIALLNEQKQAIILRAVTRGLDHNVKLKDSGVPWLGKIPVHWEVNRLKSLTRFVTSGSRGWARFYSDSGPIFLRIGNISTTSIALRLDKLTRVSPPANAEGERTQVEAGDVLLSITAQIGAVGLVPEGLGEAYVNQHTALIRLRGGSCDRRWIAYQLLSRFGKDQCLLLTNGGTKLGLSLDDVRGLVVLLPPQREQSEIVDAIVRETAGLEKQLALTEREITLAREYRTRLISDVVIGTLDVRAAAASLPDVEPELAAAKTSADEDADIDESEAA